MDMIQRMGYVNYYLIVHDFVRYAKSQDIPVGPGRGSGAGSLAAYCMGITAWTLSGMTCCLNAFSTQSG